MNGIICLFHVIIFAQLAEILNANLDVARLLITGATTANIANYLGLCPSTVSTYKTRIYEKIKVSNIIDLAAKLDFLSAHHDLAVVPE